MIIIPPVGAVCAYTFTAPFASLNGVYALTKVMSFATALTDGIDFTKTLYVPAGRSEADYLAEWTAFEDGMVLQLVAKSDGAVYHVPQALLALIPDPMVRRYHELVLTVTLGVFADPADLSFLVAQMDDIATAVTGTTGTTTLGAVEEEEIWLSDAQYAQLEAERATRKRTVVPLTTVVKTMQAEIDRLKTQLAAYEAFLVTQATAGG